MKLFKSLNPYLNPLTYLVPLILTAAWYAGMLLCPLSKDVLSGVSSELEGPATQNTLMFLLISMASIFGYLVFTFRFPSLLFRAILGVLWSPVTCVIYCFVVSECSGEGMISGAVSGSTSINSTIDSLSNLVSLFFMILVYFVCTSFLVLAALVPATIYCCDRPSHYFGLTAASKRIDAQVQPACLVRF